MSDFGIYRGDQFLGLNIKPKNFIIEKILREKDTLLFVGDEKAGKSLFISQMFCSLTSGHPFLDKYHVSQPTKVTYIQLEGELAESQDRIKRLMKYTEFAPELFQIMFLGPLNLESEEITKWVIKKSEDFKPEVLIIDPLYQAMVGSLSDDTSVRKFIGNIRRMKDKLDCSVIIVHHTHKMRRDGQGFAISEGDEATFGSRFLKAYPDHTILLSFDKASGIRTMTCSTQRTGDIEKNIRLRLIEPDPLYFEEIIDGEDVGRTGIEIIALIEKEPLTREEVEQRLKISKRTFFRTLKKIGHRLIKSSTRPTVYSIECQKDRVPMVLAQINGTDVSN